MKVLRDSIAIPIVVEDKDCRLLGVLRYIPNVSNTIVIFLPALTGTRLGPQNLFVHISRHLLNENVASLCIELPPSGDSFSKNEKSFNEGTYKQNMIAKYSFYLDKIMNHLRSHFSFSKVILSSISVGSVPVMEYASRNNFTASIMLSPNHLEDEIIKFNKKNLKAYYLKLGQKETWIKIIQMKLNWGRIFKNVINLQARFSRKRADPLMEKSDRIQGDILCIFGGKDLDLAQNKVYWDQFQKKYPSLVFEENIINGSDHSFFGWEFKEKVSDAIINWIKIK